MKGLVTLSPRQLVCVGLGGGLMAAGSFLILDVVRIPHALSLTLLVAMTPLLLGFWIGMKAGTEIEAGIAAERWSFEQQGILSMFSSPLFAVVFAGMCIAAIVCMIPTHGHKLARSIGWGMFGFAQVLSQLVRASRQPKPSQPPYDWRQIQPIQSEHWGQHD